MMKNTTVQDPSTSFHQSPAPPNSTTASRNSPNRVNDKRFCEICCISVTKNNWSRDIKSLNHNEHLDQPTAYPTHVIMKRRHEGDIRPAISPKRVNENKKCETCNVDVRRSNWARHLKSPSHNNRVVPHTPAPIQADIVDFVSDEPSAVSVIRHSNDLTRISSVARPSTSRPSSSETSVSGLFILSSTELKISKIKTAFKGRLATHSINNPAGGIKDPIEFLLRCKPLVYGRIHTELETQQLKINLLLNAYFTRGVGDCEEKEMMNFKTSNEIVLEPNNITAFYTAASRKILKEMEEFETKGSQWKLARIDNLEMRVNRYQPLGGSSYLELPKWIQDKKAVVNIKNQDNKCFLWSVLAALYPSKHPYRVQHYIPHEYEFDEVMKGINYPVAFHSITTFENLSNLSVNVYGFEGTTIYPRRVTDNEREKHINLLYTSNGETSHYCLIKDLSRLVRSQITRHEHRMWICNRCLLHFYKKEDLQAHNIDCKTHEAVKVTLPKKEDIIQFKEFERVVKVPFVMYADFECMLTPIQSCSQSEENSYTNAYQEHKAVSFCSYIVNSNGDYKDPVKYFGTDAGEKFVEMVESEAETIAQQYKTNNKMIPLTAEEMNNASACKTCYMCDKKLVGVRMLDHDHLTGKFRGMVHPNCNLQCRRPTFIPVFIHNLSGYDAHLFIKMFGLNDETIDVIPDNEERYIAFNVKLKCGLTLRFLDSFKFMSQSLDRLVENLERSQFNHTSKFFNDREMDLVCRKGVYPYDYMDDIKKYEETALPAPAAFYNRLTNTTISEDDYKHAQLVWTTFDMQSLKEYTLLYNQTDVLQLADVMENFRNLCMETYRLDPAWFYTTPGLAWSAMLKTTGVKLEPLTDYDMVLMIEKGIRGGISQCSHRHALANNPHVENYNSNSPTTYLTYLDANNLYGWAMSQHMPYRQFRWSHTEIDVTNVSDYADTGYILEVDLEYPKELHDLHSDLPLAPEHRAPPGLKATKLLNTLYDKSKYVVHYQNLKLYLRLGMKLKKIHRVISFQQQNWLRPYINLNTEKRKQAVNDFEKDFYKLMNNSVFGKTVENIRRRVQIRLATKESQVTKWIAKPNFKHATIFNENLAAIHMSPTKVLFNKPIYIGASILDVSKTLMYQFHYDVMVKRYGKDGLQLLYSDTDSLMYSVRTENFYQDMKLMIDHFDTSDYPMNNQHDMPLENKKVLGKMKDELNGKIMREYAGLRSKMYAIDIPEKSIKKSKGVKKSVVEKELKFEDYKECLFSKERVYRKMNVIRSIKHDLSTQEINKVALSAADDKRFILEDGISTLAWGHHRIPQLESNKSNPDDDEEEEL